MAKQSYKVTHVELLQIDVENRLRGVSVPAAEQLAASIEEHGLQTPIKVRRLKDGGLRLIEGGHRYAAAIMLEWATIPAFVIKCNDYQAQMMEIDENLAREELSPLHKAVFMNKRKALYDKEHPDKVGKVAGGLGRQGLASDNLSFAELTAEKTPFSKRKVYRLVRAAARLTPDEILNLEMVPGGAKEDDLLALDKVTDEKQRAEVIEALVSGTVKNAKAAIAQLSDKTETEKDPFKEGLNALKKAWKAAPIAAKREFLVSQADLRDLLDGAAE